ncbi:unnamed protein product [Thelazia callipaeda]|uniref:Olfactomedin-like domain-containing protein n=1 Tax=Thelazia callipaeda TaxID=103827 RepID=A0A0N5D050_THECL|nr:unnamed protein product [Thelazia callipaeda]
MKTDNKLSKLLPEMKPVSDSPSYNGNKRGLHDLQLLTFDNLNMHVTFVTIIRRDIYLRTRFIVKLYKISIVLFKRFEEKNFTEISHFALKIYVSRIFAVCFLDAVGIPVLHAESQYSAVGSWMRDNKPYSHEMAERRWVTDDYASPVLYEYENERQLMNKKQKIKYYVDYLASGTGSIIFNGSYYYHRHSSSILVKYDLESTDQIQKSLGDISYLDCSRRRDHTFENCNETERDIWLYNRPHNYIDYGADENGLWVVYVRSGMKHITVSKIEPDMKIVRTWNIYELNATDIAETFIMCGVLYGLKSVTDRDTFINFAYDLYRNKTIDVNVKWYNPFGGLTMLHYNPTDKRLYFFDSKRLLSVNVRVEGETDQFEFEEDD